MAQPPPRRTEWRTPKSFTILADLEPAQVAPLRAELTRHGDDIKQTVGVDFARVKTLHFFRMQVLPDPLGEFPDQLLINSMFDGPVEAHARELETQLGAWLTPLLERHVSGFDGGAAAWMLAHRVPDDTVHIGSVGATAEDTRQEAHLRATLSRLADARREKGEWGPGTSAESIRMAMRQAIEAAGDPGLPSTRRAELSLGAKLRQTLDLARAGASPLSGLLRTEMRKWLLGPQWWPGSKPWAATVEVLLVLHWAWTVLPSQAFLRYVRHLEVTEPDEVVDVDMNKVRELVIREDHQAQNPLTMYTPLRRGFRPWLLSQSLAGAESATRHIWSTGRLAGIATIHCARFLQVRKGKRMLFLSDYDGSWERYLLDFLAVGSVAVVPLWGHLHGCAKTHWLFGTTPGFGPRFLALTRRYQSPAELWYSAWSELSLNNLLSNARLRRGLYADQMTEAEARVWLAELG